MNLQQFEYLKRIAETKSFTAAAAMIPVTQPALSKAIAKLEEELQVPLLEREGRNVTLTAYGRAFLKHAEFALLSIQNGITEINVMKNHRRNTIRMAATPCIGAMFSPQIISEFLKEHTDTEFHFNYVSAFDIKNGLKDGSIDIGFLDAIEEEEDSRLVSTQVSKMEYVVVVPKSHPLALETEVSLLDLKEENFIILRDVWEETKDIYNNCFGYEPKISVLPKDASMLMSLVSAGAGITIIPETSSINGNMISIVRLKERLGYKTITMVYNKEITCSDTVKRFREFVILSNEEV